ncbi:hypothetical protein FXN63_17900 [Pigmentiphaga aceris]|uniref:DUF7822 domain-containing protein n=1 Tax=Pigmentiphaga aceris TaxID=1940612 RepID=A0A5C0AYH8_9BURK|nr:hypothetical protein [Pigmentiphaga aceris]QEI07502.1 hypothetical protein FXN63_17900 [Pigmentiphaga aceris]
MANRSYLYSTNVVPDHHAAPAERKRIGISEWAWDTPLVYRLLLSGNPRTCPSTIWNLPEEIAIVGDYAQGVEKLRAFLSRITLPDAQPMIAEALAFLDDTDNQQTWLVLESGELYDMEDDDMAQLNARMLASIEQVDQDAEAMLTALQPGYRGGPDSAHQTSEEALAELGLDNWSNVLYFDLTD